MITKSIQNRPEHKIDARQNVPSSGGDDLFNEFSKTLDEIALQVAKQHTGAAEIPAVPVNLAKPKTNVEKPKQEAKPEPRGDEHKSDKAEKALSEEKPEHDAAHESNREVAQSDKPKKAADVIQGQQSAETAKNGQKSDVLKEASKNPEDSIDAESGSDQGEQLHSEFPEDTDLSESVVDDAMLSEELVSQAASEIVSEKLMVKDPQPVKESEEPGEESEGTDPELSEPFFDVAPQLEQDPTEVPVDATKTISKEVTPVAVETRASEIAPSSEEILAAAQEVIANIADQNIVTQAQLEIAPRQPKEIEGLNPDQKVADAFARVIQDMLQNDQNNQLNQLFTRSLYTQPTEEAASVLKRLYGAARLQELGGASNQMQAQGLQINSMGAFSKADSAHQGETKAQARPLPKMAEMRTMEKVENALKEIARSKDGKTISVRLDPPELGTVKIDVSYRDGGLHARIVAESPQVTQLLREKNHEVVQMLRKAGITVEKLTVSVGSGSEQFEGGTANTFESFRQREGGDPSHSGHGNGNRAQGAMMTAGRVSSQLIKDDHWIA